jgi:hypothetical protein
MSSRSDAQSWSTKWKTLEQELRQWWDQKNETFEADVEEDTVEDDELWHQMPTIDSKEVTRASHIFEEHLDMEFDLSVIRAGGYGSIDDMINHLIPKLMDEVQQNQE